MAEVSVDLDVKQLPPRLDGNQLAADMAYLNIEFSHLLQALEKIDSLVLGNLSKSSHKEFFKDYAKLDHLTSIRKLSDAITFSSISFLHLPFQITAVFDNVNLDWVSLVFTDGIKIQINRILVNFSIDGSGDLEKIFTNKNRIYETMKRLSLDTEFLDFSELFSYLKIISSNASIDLQRKFHNGDLKNFDFSLNRLDDLKEFVSDLTWDNFRNIKYDLVKEIDIRYLLNQFTQYPIGRRTNVYQLFTEEITLNKNSNEIQKLKAELIALQNKYETGIDRRLDELAKAKLEFENLKESTERVKTNLIDETTEVARSNYGQRYLEQYTNSLKLFNDWGSFNSPLFLWSALGFAISIVSFGLIIYILIENKFTVQQILIRLSFIPISSLLIWFCFHQYNKQKNIIEEYAHKKTVAMSLAVFADRLDEEQNPEIKQRFYETVFEALHTSPIERLQKNSGKNESELIAEIGKEIIVHQSKNMISPSKDA